MRSLLVLDPDLLGISMLLELDLVAVSYTVVLIVAAHGQIFRVHKGLAPSRELSSLGAATLPVRSMSAQTAVVCFMPKVLFQEVLDQLPQRLRANPRQVQRLLQFPLRPQRPNRR